MISILLPSVNEHGLQHLIYEIDSIYPCAQIVVGTDRYRKGKGWALRQALSQATGDIIVFLDGDGDISPKMIARLLPHLDKFDIVCGKKEPGNRLDRKILTILSRMYIRFMFGIPVDTQTGIKVFKRDHLPEWESDGFEFDIEVLAKAQRAGSKMFDVGVEARCERKMKLNAIFATLKGSFKIWLNLQKRK